MKPIFGRRRRRVMAIITTGFISLFAVTTAAWAAATDNMFPTAHTGGTCWTGMDYGAPCQTDNKAVYFYMDSHGEYELESPDRSMVNKIIDREYRPTDLAFHYDSSPVFSGSGETDIVYQEGSTGLSDNAVGTTWCNAAGGDGYDCDQQYIRIRGYGNYDEGTTCHETGHAVGLQHGNNSSPQLSNTDDDLGCMVTPTSSGWPFLLSNNIENIDATY